jgi:cytochrome c oxidase subunit 2
MKQTRITLAMLFLSLLSSIASPSGAQQSSNTIEVHARRFAFVPTEITVRQGEAVHLRLSSDDVPHSLLVKELGINQVVTKAHPENITFTPQKAGDYHGQCGRFCGSGHGQMLFTVHVIGN